MKLGKVYISYGFIILIAVLYYLDTQNLFLPLLTAALVHELGHYCAVRAQGGQVARLRLTGVGAVMETNGGAIVSYPKELAATLAGPAASLCAAFVSSALGTLTGLDGLFVFSGINLVFAIFNMLPVRQLDGGKAVYLILACLAGPQTADKICNAVTYLFIIFLYAAGGWVFYYTGSNFTLMAAAVWLMFTAGSENGIVTRLKRV